MYSFLPQPQRFFVRFALAASWGLSALGGATTLVWAPETTSHEIGAFLPVIWGTLIFAASVAAAAGVSIDRYRIEWIAAWFAGSGFILYAGTLWWVALVETPTRLPQALFLTALLVHTLLRAVMCSAHAARLRAKVSIDTGGIKLDD